MGFSQDQGYTPATVPQIMTAFMANINPQFGTSYTDDTFIGTNFYKYFYAIAQRLQENEVKTSEIFLKLQNYFSLTNERIFRPNTTAPGIIDYFLSHGFLASVKPPLSADAGKLYVAVDVDDTAPGYAGVKLDICNLVKDCCIAGVISQGTEVETLVISNDQSFDFKFNLASKIPVKLKITITQSANSQFVIDTPDQVKAKLIANITARYRMGLNFEPQRYYSVIDAPWAASILLEYSLDGGSTWASAIYSAAYNDLFTYAIGDITVVEV